jgi:hypothetical protein
MVTTQAQLEKIVARRFDEIRKVLLSKSKEYTSEGDRLANFRRAASMLEVSPEQALVGMWAKHVISITDLATWAADNDSRLTPEIVDEKIVDTINYMILLEALFQERFSDVLTLESSEHGLKKVVSKHIFSKPCALDLPEDK